MRLIAVDIGNSACKVALNAAGPSDSIGCDVIVNGSRFQDIQDHLPDTQCRWCLASVDSNQARQIADWLERNRPHDPTHWIVLDDLPLNLNVDRPRLVGLDRLVAAFAAVEQCRPRDTQLRSYVKRDSLLENPLVIVDAGTAVTVDLVDTQAVFQGGWIFPGVDAACHQLADRTDALPRLNYATRIGALDQLPGSGPQESHPSLPGKNTLDAIVRGVYLAQLGGIESMVHQVIQRSDRRPEVWITGRGIDELVAADQKLLPTGEHWLNRIDKAHHWVPNLVLQGIAILGQKHFVR